MAVRTVSMVVPRVVAVICIVRVVSVVFRAVVVVLGAVVARVVFRGWFT